MTQARAVKKIKNVPIDKRGNGKDKYKAPRVEVSLTDDAEIRWEFEKMFKGRAEERSLRFFFWTTLTLDGVPYTAPFEFTTKAFTVQKDDPSVTVPIAPVFLNHADRIGRMPLEDRTCEYYIVDVERDQIIVGQSPPKIILTTGV